MAEEDDGDRIPGWPDPPEREEPTRRDEAFAEALLGRRCGDLNAAWRDAGLQADATAEAKLAYLRCKRVVEAVRRETALRSYEAVNARQSNVEKTRLMMATSLSDFLDFSGPEPVLDFGRATPEQRAVIKRLKIKNFYGRDGELQATEYDIDMPDATGVLNHHAKLHGLFPKEPAAPAQAPVTINVTGNVIPASGAPTSAGDPDDEG